jgi:hypothetical protein
MTAPDLDMALGYEGIDAELDTLPPYCLTYIKNRPNLCRDRIGRSSLPISKLVLDNILCFQYTAAINHFH